jgi:hypothetical protein
MRLTTRMRQKLYLQSYFHEHKLFFSCTPPTLHMYIPSTQQWTPQVYNPCARQRDTYNPVVPQRVYFYILRLWEAFVWVWLSWNGSISSIPRARSRCCQSLCCHMVQWDKNMTWQQHTCTNCTQTTLIVSRNSSSRDYETSSIHTVCEGQAVSTVLLSWAPPTLHMYIPSTQQWTPQVYNPCARQWDRYTPVEPQRVNCRALDFIVASHFFLSPFYSNTCNCAFCHVAFKVNCRNPCPSLVQFATRKCDHARTL